MTGLTVMFSEQTAWRGVYVYWARTLLFSLVLDPTAQEPSCLGQVGRWAWRRKLPVLQWRTVAGPALRAGKRHPLVVLYRFQQWLLHGLDGRYGWGRRGA